MLLSDADAHLVARARDGDDLAFGQLVLRHHSSAQRTARAIVGSTWDAEDVVQDAWLHAYVHLDRFEGTAAFKTWVQAIVRNRAVDHYRSARRRRRFSSVETASAETLADMRCGEQSPEELALYAERRDRLAAAIAALPTPLRDLLELWHTGQYSYEELARISGVALSTIKSRVWDARKRVTRALQH